MPKQKSWKTLGTVFQVPGSVFPFAFRVALPCSLLTAMLKVADVMTFEGFDGFLKEWDVNAAAYGGFSTLLGFLVVFRTSEAYGRFWDGSTLTHQLRGDWFDAASSLIAFSRNSKSDVMVLKHFQHKVVRLFSMLHALSLAEVEDDADEEDERWAFELELPDVECLDRVSLLALKASSCKVELVFHWIQCLVVDALASGILNTPPPIVTRAYQELASGMVKFHECLKIARVPLPFPYTQTTMVLLIIHWCLTPVMLCTWTKNAIVASSFAFIQVFILWGLHAIATELENPFGADANDLNVADMQRDMNHRLLMLLDPSSQRVPTFEYNPSFDYEELKECEKSCFKVIWAGLDPSIPEGFHKVINERAAVRRSRIKALSRNSVRQEAPRGKTQRGSISNSTDPVSSFVLENSLAVAKQVMENHEAKMKPNIDSQSQALDLEAPLPPKLTSSAASELDKLAMAANAACAALGSFKMAYTMVPPQTDIVDATGKMPNSMTIAPMPGSPAIAARTGARDQEIAWFPGDTDLPPDDVASTKASVSGSQYNSGELPLRTGNSKKPSLMYSSRLRDGEDSKRGRIGRLCPSCTSANPLTRAL